jgi:hypothetical protein
MVFKINIPRIKYKHIPIRPIRRRIPKTMNIHDQHGQSAFNPKARTRLNPPLDGPVVVVVTG